MPEHLFVYGTLRAESAHPMAHRLRVGARHIGKGRAPGLLYDFGSWPGAFFALEEKYRVIGSVFALGPNPRLLSDLDKYEGVVPTDEEREFPESAGLFHRIAIEVHLDHGGSVEAWAYALEGHASGQADRHRRFHRRPQIARAEGPPLLTLVHRERFVSAPRDR